MATRSTWTLRIWRASTHQTLSDPVPKTMGLKQGPLSWNVAIYIYKHRYMYVCVERERERKREREREMGSETVPNLVAETFTERLPYATP